MKKILLIIISILTIISSLPISTSAVSPCGDNVEWSFDSSTCTLTISGTGELFTTHPYSVDCDEIPWENFKHRIRKLVINEGITEIDYEAFRDCTGLISVSLPKSLTYIGEWVFAGCESLEVIELPEGLITIGLCAFQECTNLSKVILPSTLSMINEAAFENCISLKEITIPANVNFIQGNIFSMSGVEFIDVDDDNPYYSNDEYGALFDKNKNTLIGYPVGSTNTEYTIPDGVKRVGGDAFFGAKVLKKITFPTSIIEINNSNGFLLLCCDNLTEICFKGTKEQWDKIAINGENPFKEFEINFVNLEEEVTNAYNNQGNNNPTTPQQNMTMYIVAGVLISIMIIGGAFVLIRKKKKKQ